MSKQRGYYLSNTGYDKLWAKLREKMEKPNAYRILAYQKEEKTISLDQKTIHKIIHRKVSVDKLSIECLFNWFDLPLRENEDLTRDRHDPNFLGREEAIADINRIIGFVSSPGDLTNFTKEYILVFSANSSTGGMPFSRICQIVAPGGQGKTTLARKYLKNNFKTVLEFTIAKETKDIASVESLLEEKLRQLGEEPGREFMVSLDRFKQKLQTQPIGILIDNLEPALKLDGSGQFLPEHSRYLELLRALSDSSLQSLTLITSRERLNEGLDITLYSLPSLTVSAWGEFWQYQGINTDITLLTEIHKAYGGNALAMKVLSNLILNDNDYQGDIVVYWQKNKTEDNLEVETTVANLIKEQFERLQTINLDAYNLLCRLGCYRYQDVPTVPEAGLNCLLWDVEENQHKRIIRVLKERALVEFNNSDYWLHPVIRQVAIDILRKSDHWEKANTQAAEFWTESVKTVETVKDALTAFEAYYHYLNIKDFEMCGEIIIKPRDNKWELKEELGYSFWRFGLLSPMIVSSNKISNKISSSYILSQLYHLLGDLYWLIGSIYNAIDCHEKSKNYAKNAIEKNNNCNYVNRQLYNLFISSFHNQGLCYIDLNEIEEAFQKFKDTENLSLNENNKKYLFNSKFCISFLLSLNKENNVIDIINEVLQQKDNIQEVYLDAWNRGYSLLFLGLSFKNINQINKSFILYKEAINYANKSDFIQVKGKALTGLAELYRIQNDLEKALTHHQQSIEILDKIGAKCDLAEAYFQLALTYQQMGEQANAQEYFNKAMYLWSPEQIDAPKQIERVKKAMNCEP